MRYILIILMILLHSSIAIAGISVEYKVSYTKNHPLVDANEVLPDKIILSVDRQYAKIENFFSHGASTKLNLYYKKEENVYIAELLEKIIDVGIINTYDPAIVGGSVNNFSTGGHNISSTNSTIRNSKTVYPLVKANYDIQHLDNTAQIEILGYPCKRARGKLNDSKIEILYTDVLKHQYFQYGDLNGIALLYKMQDEIFEEVVYTATNVKKVNFDSDFFNFPKINSDFNNVYSDNVLINTFADNIKARNLNNTKVTLDFHQNKITVLYFWSIRYLINQSAIEKLNKLREKYEEDDRVQFISIAQERPKYLRFFIKNTEMKYQVFGSGAKAIRQFKADILPANVVIAPGGKIVFHQTHYWPTTAFVIDSLLEKLLDNHFATVEQ
jgi:hypothetical protein